MEEKLSLKIIIKVLLFCLIGVILLQIATKVLIPKWIYVEDNRMTYIVKGFYKEPQNSLDVVFMGNSDVYRGISPITLSDEYGIASYNFVSSGQRMWTAYYMMEECLKYQKPKLIVLNMDSAFNESQSSESNYRKIFDNMKFGTTKLKAITDSVYKNSSSEIASYVFPIVRYHSRWSELTDDDFTKAFENERFAYKGLDLTTVSKPYNDGQAYMTRNMQEEQIGENCTKYLEKMIELCKENNIQLILIELPSAESWSLDLSNKTNKFATEHGLEFIDLNLKINEIGLDWTKDTSDAGDHLNVYGAEKVSKYLGKIIQQKYNLPNHKSDAEYKEWISDSEKYHKDKNEFENK